MLLEIYDRGVPRADNDDQMFGKVVDYCKGNEGVATDAILMQPRPEWLRKLIGFNLMRR